MPKTAMVTSGDISILPTPSKMGIYRKNALILEISKEEAKDLMTCFFEFINMIQVQDTATKAMKGKRLKKTSKHK